MHRLAPLFIALLACSDAQDDADTGEPCSCPAVEAPVCADGITYGNDCMAECEGVTDYTDGACEDEDEADSL